MRLFIDFPKYNLKAVLLHNDNKKESIPHSISMKENIKIILNAITRLLRI